MILNFGEWTPDLPDIDNPGALTATNVYPAQGFYRPFKDFVPYSTSLSGTCIGGATVYGLDGSAHLFAGDGTGIYKLSAGSNAFARVASGLTATDYVSFTQFGDRVIYANGNSALLKFDLASDTSFSAIATAPVASYVGVVGDFLVAVKIASNPQRVEWPGIDSTGPWGTNAATLADDQDVVGTHGEATGFVGGDYGLVFFKRAIGRMDFVGAPLAFQFRIVERQRGTRCPGSIAAIGQMVFFLAEDGFYMWNGSQAVPIGEGKIDRTFLDDFDQTYESRVKAGIDPINKMYVCAYPGTGSVTGSPNRMMVYHWPTGRWSRVEMSLEGLLPTVGGFGITLDGLDAIYSSIDAIPLSLDSPAFQAGGTVFGGFNTGHRFGFFNGANLAATLETKEGQVFEGHRAFVNSTRAVIDGGNPMIAIGHRQRQTDSVTYATAVGQNAIGEHPQRVNNRYLRGKMTTDAGSVWSKAVGVEFTAVQEGRR